MQIAKLKFCKNEFILLIIPTSGRVSIWFEEEIKSWPFLNEIIRKKNEVSYDFLKKDDEK